MKSKFLHILARFFFRLGLLALLPKFVERFQAKKTDNCWSFPFIQRRLSGTVQILTYHRVNDEHDPFFPAVPVRVFTEQIEYLASHFPICSLAEAVEQLKRKDVPENLLVITFDDGYRDNYLHAFPVLKKFSVPATIFLATAAIGTDVMLWHDLVFSAFRETKMTYLQGGKIGLPDQSLKNVSEKLNAQTDILRFLRSLDDETRDDYVQRLREVLQVTEPAKAPSLMLNWDDVRTMHKHGISLGSHTLTHPIMSKVQADRARQEICESRAVIESQLGVSPTAFAYPNGGRADFTPFTKQALMDAGYECAVTTIFGVNTVAQDLFELRRGGAWGASLPAFVARLNWYSFNIPLN